MKRKKEICPKKFIVEFFSLFNIFDIVELYFSWKLQKKSSSTNRVCTRILLVLKIFRFGPFLVLIYRSQIFTEEHIGLNILVINATANLTLSII